jgi:NAD(P)-dependent dehydrogenase (short-subunit alcohol dehydrogenase family)
MDRSLSGKLCLVTGGAGRLGTAFCEGIVRAGGRVAIADVNKDFGIRLVDALNSSVAGQASFVPMDIGDAASVRAGLEQVLKSSGKVDALVNNAYPRNARYGRTFFKVEYGDFCENVSTHLGGYFLCSQVFADYFSRIEDGNIVNIASVYGFQAPRFDLYAGTEMTMPVEYAVLKAGVLQLTRYMASLLKGKSIRVNSISPGGIDAEQPQSFKARYGAYCSTKGLLAADDVTGALLFLLSDASASITGQNIIVDDGFTL